MRLIESILADAASITKMRRDIHAHPELCFEEQRTSDLIAKALTDWGIPVERGLGKTGVVGIVRNGTSKRAGKGANREALIGALESIQGIDLGGFLVTYGARDHVASAFVDLTMLTEFGGVRV